MSWNSSVRVAIVRTEVSIRDLTNIEHERFLLCCAVPHFNVTRRLRNRKQIMSDEAWTWTGIARSHSGGLRAAFFIDVYLSFVSREKTLSRRARAVQFCHIFQFIQLNWVVRMTLNTWYHLWLDYIPRDPTPPVCVGLCTTWFDTICDLYCIPRDPIPYASWTVYHVIRHRLWVVLYTTWSDIVCELYCIPRNPKSSELYCVPRDRTSSVSCTVYHVTRHHMRVGLCTTWPNRNVSKSRRLQLSCARYLNPSCCIALCEEGFNPKIYFYSLLLSSQGVQGVLKKRRNFCYKDFIAHFTAF
jgi:hypothetical protein